MVNEERSPQNGGDFWVGAWAAAQQLTEPDNLPPLPGLVDTTLRQVVRVTLGGTRLRARFSNVFGTVPLTIHAAHVARAAPSGAIQSGSDRELTFHGAGSVIIPPGESMISDPTSFPLSALSDLAVTIHVRDVSKKITGHPGARCTSYLRAGSSVSALSLPGASITPYWYYLSGVEVATESSAAAVAVLGDSITDGRGSTTDGNGRWTDGLARRLQTDHKTSHLGVLNVGIGGNRVCCDGLGPSALSRLDRDVLSQSGMRWLILLEGINDLGTRSASAQDLITAYAQIVSRARTHGLLVYGGTLTPCGGSDYFCPDLETARQAVNAWTRTDGHFDAMVDFDAAVRDPQNPAFLQAVVDSGDHLHLNDVGYKIMADAVDLGLFAAR